MPREFSFSLRVYYEDTDAGGVVYHSNYLNFFERARTECLRELGLEQTRLREEEGILFAVRTAQIDYHRPARLDDALDVRSRILRCRPASLEFHQRLGRSGDAAVLVEARVRIACIAAEQLRPLPLPEPLVRILSDVC